MQLPDSGDNDDVACVWGVIAAREYMIIGHEKSC
jgi:hypothetical protein